MVERGDTRFKVFVKCLFPVEFGWTNQEKHVT